jgi:hypothetical protein
MPDPDEMVTVPRRYLEQVAYAATAWASMLAMRKAMGAPLVPQGASVRIDGGRPVQLTEDQVDLPLLMESVRETRKRLGWIRG